MLAGHLKARGIHVQRSRLRGSIHRIDPQGVVERRLHTIRRRTYHAPAPNYVWHLDDTHKLIKWKLVVHAGIDGYSRLITYCSCANNNKAETVLRLFRNAVHTYGLPLRVRTDHGVENVGVWEYMLLERANTNALIIGSSVHNQRVERLHFNINTQVVNRFYNEFSELEDAGILNSTNEADLFCLHLVYLPKINACLQEFVNAYNNHCLSTEGNQTPLQLYNLNYRLLQLQQLDPSGTIDIRGIAARSSNNIVVPPIRNPLNEEQNRQLRALLFVNRHMTLKDLYKFVAEFIAEILG